MIEKLRCASPAPTDPQRRWPDRLPDAGPALPGGAELDGCGLAGRQISQRDVTCAFVAALTHRRPVPPAWPNWTTSTGATGQLRRQLSEDVPGHGGCPGIGACRSSYLDVDSHDGKELSEHPYSRASSSPRVLVPTLVVGLQRRNWVDSSADTMISGRHRRSRIRMKIGYGRTAEPCSGQRRGPSGSSYQTCWPWGVAVIPKRS
jgi:hypothetical protein